ncbi:MAG: copper amine oxidase N-terminal domain-containing protein, partial [Peptococcaceae bacterium]|nr:copper amine oxidase N-terminal domain-containing protein [Peptococcaceae bacterium]
TNQPGNYVLVEKSDIVKIDMFIGNTISIINGEAIANDVAAYIANDRTMVPAAFIMDQLGCKVDWFGDERKVVITLPDGSQLSMIIDQEIPGFGAVPVIKDDRTMVPIAYIADAMGAHVLWVGDEYRVVIVK